jgi:hypothetical protein
MQLLVTRAGQAWRRDEPSASHQSHKSLAAERRREFNTREGESLASDSLPGQSLFTRISKVPNSEKTLNIGTGALCAFILDFTQLSTLQQKPKSEHTQNFL